VPSADFWDYTPAHTIKLGDRTRYGIVTAVNNAYPLVMFQTDERQTKSFHRYAPVEVLRTAQKTTA